MSKRFDIHEWQAKQRLVEFDVHPFSRQYDGPGEEGEMAKADITEVIDDAQDIAKMIDPDTNLPEWVEAKITKAADYLNKVKDYLSNYDVRKNDIDEMSTTGGGASFNAGSGEGYMTPKAFKKKNKED